MQVSSVSDRRRGDAGHVAYHRRIWVRRIAAAYGVSYDAFLKHALGRAGRGARDLDRITEAELLRLSAGSGVPMDTLRRMGAEAIMVHMNERVRDWLLSEDGREALDELRVTLGRMARRRKVEAAIDAYRSTSQSSTSCGA